MSDVIRPDGSERRQTARVSLGDGIECRLELRERVRLIDISLSGAMLSADLALPIGTRAELRSGLAARPFAADVQVRRATTPSPRSRNGLGAVFTGMDERSRRSLEEFLRKASE
jgi:hypothetical protein